jgi:succinate dehydrogenase / fumarate reductase iron-sulfur subunit
MHESTTPSPGATSESHHNGHPPPRSFEVRVLRQDRPGESSYWERHRVPYERDMNVISVLQKIAALATTIDGRHVAPVAWDCNCLEEVCGSCTMVINGRTRMACTALVDRLLADNPDEIELRPMSRFPVVRDLLVDRARLFQGLMKVKAWVPVDGYYNAGPGPRQSQEQQQTIYPITECISCGCCLEACPQYAKLEIARRENESDEQFEERKRRLYDREFMGAAIIAQAMRFNYDPTGSLNKSERLDALMSEGGIQMCGNAQNCVAVCPKEIPLTREIARAGRSTTVHALKKIFDR